MARRHTSKTLDEARQVLEGWRQITPDAPIGDLTKEKFAQTIAQTDAILSELAALDVQAVNKRNQRDALYHELGENSKRVRSGIKASHGDDSSEYEMVGGTRTSERKSRGSDTPPAE